MLSVPSSSSGGRSGSARLTGTSPANRVKSGNRSSRVNGTGANRTVQGSAKARKISKNRSVYNPQSNIVEEHK